GAETSAQQFIQHLLALGHELELFTRSRPSPAPGLEVTVVRCPATTRSGRSAAFARAVDKLLARSDADVIHAISPCLRADVYEPRGGTVPETIARNLALRRSRATRSLKRLANRFNLRQRLMLDLERRLLTREPRPMVVALSDYVIDQLRRHYAFPETHIRKIFNGVDPDPADDQQRRRDRREIRGLYGIDDDALLVILVAHNFKLKGVGRWIEALRLLDRDGGPKLQSLVIGRDNPVHWQRVAAAAGVGDRVQFVGPTRRMAAFYRAADVLVHPTYYDPCSRVVLEAMAAGLACVTTRYDGAAEMIDEGLSGYVLDSPEDVPSLVRAVETLADADRRSAMGRAAADRSGGASMRRHTEQVVELYAELCGRRTTA
ncbi:MAG: glycosyltransferase family 4 protein, partial [Planctomycetes bacterium]|nr:glycosyltransferase family 4 protein [Planctomycetota bacterium]